MNRTAQILAAADAAIARADAVTAAQVGKAQTDAMYVAQWTADEEAMRACRAAARLQQPEWVRAQYRASASFFASQI